MNKKMLLLACLFGWVLQALAGIKVSTTQPGVGKPEHLYTMVNGNGIYANGMTGTTQTETKYGQFAFYETGTSGQYFIYSYTANKWVSYTQASSYSEGTTNFVKMSDQKSETSKFIINEYATDKYQIQPVTSSGTGDRYLNWYQGRDSNPLDNASVTLGLWKQNGTDDAGSRWTFSEVIPPAW